MLDGRLKSAPADRGGRFGDELTNEDASISIINFVLVLIFFQDALRHPAGNWLVLGVTLNVLGLYYLLHDVLLPLKFV